MRFDFLVSRRNIITLAAGAVTVSAVPAAAATAAIAATPTGSFSNLFAATRQRVLAELVRVRQARGNAGRAEAFASLAAALRFHGWQSDAHSASANVAGGASLALYHGRDPSTVLAQVIVRELAAQRIDDRDWMTRFTDLEKVIHSQVA